MGGNSALTIFLLMVSIVLVPLGEARQVLLANDVLVPGEFLEYEDYKLKLEDDCNLVLYDSDYKVWRSNATDERRDCYCTLDKEGRLVIMTEDRPIKEVWASSKFTGEDSGNHVLVLQDDGNVVLYGPNKWETGTGQFLNARMSLKMAKTKPTNAAAAAH